MEAKPRFTVTKTNPPKVMLHCSNCDVIIREIGMKESIAVNKGYYCKGCDDGAIHLNMPK